MLKISIRILGTTGGRASEIDKKGTKMSACRSYGAKHTHTTKKKKAMTPFTYTQGGPTVTYIKTEHTSV
jgi:hypothetical protein